MKKIFFLVIAAITLLTTAASCNDGCGPTETKKLETARGFSIGDEVETHGFGTYGYCGRNRAQYIGNDQDTGTITEILSVKEGDSEWATWFRVDCGWGRRSWHTGGLSCAD